MGFVGTYYTHELRNVTACNSTLKYYLIGEGKLFFSKFYVPYLDYVAPVTSRHTDTIPPPTPIPPYPNQMNGFSMYYDAGLKWVL